MKRNYIYMLQFQYVFIRKTKLYRTRETEGSRPAMKNQRNERVNLSCK
jgi:hypothetical protein